VTAASGLRHFDLNDLLISSRTTIKNRIYRQICMNVCITVVRGGDTKSDAEIEDLTKCSSRIRSIFANRVAIGLRRRLNTLELIELLQQCAVEHLTTLIVSSRRETFESLVL